MRSNAPSRSRSEARGRWLRPAAAQHLLEARLADPKYLYLDWNCTFPRGAIVDLFYAGASGSDEFNLGGGYGFKPSPSFTMAPLVYGVFAGQGEQRGVKLAVLASFETDGWKATAFLLGAGQGLGVLHPRDPAPDLRIVERLVHRPALRHDVDERLLRKVLRDSPDDLARPATSFSGS